MGQKEEEKMIDLNASEQERILTILALCICTTAPFSGRTDRFPPCRTDGEWGTNRVMLQADYDLYLKLGGDPNYELLKLFRGYWQI